MHKMPILSALLARMAGVFLFISVAKFLAFI
jgi:hypothetical protein